MAENKYLSRDEAVDLLLRSVDEWNAYRKAHPDYCPNLSRAVLKEADGIYPLFVCRRLLLRIQTIIQTFWWD
jgi:hypothetical protein